MNLETQAQEKDKRDVEADLNPDRPIDLLGVSASGRPAGQPQAGGTTEDTDYRPVEGLSPKAWRNVKIALVTLGVLGNVAMRFGLVGLLFLTPANRQRGMHP